MNIPNTYQLPNPAELLHILAHALDGIVVYTSKELHIGYINNEMLKLWKKDKNIIGKKLIDAAPEFAEFIPILMQVWEESTTYEARNTFANLDIDGVLTPTPFDFSYQAVVGEDGKTYAIINSAKDVTDRLKIENALDERQEKEAQVNLELHALNEDLQVLNEEYQATNEELQTTMEELAVINEEYRSTNEQLNLTNEKLNENEHTLSLALQAGKLGSYDLELSTGLMECSDQCKLNFGKRLDERFDFADLFDAIIPEYRDMVRDKVAESIQKNTIYNAQYQIKRPDGSLHWIQANGSPRYDVRGNAVRMVGVTQLITEKKNYDLRKDEFLSVASHELKTPLTALKGNLQMLDRIKGRITDEAVLKLLDSAVRSMNKVNGMVEDLLEAGKYSEGNLTLNKTRFDLSSILEDCYIHLSEEELPKLSVDATPISIDADQNRIGQVIINFINNAFKYAPQSKIIILKTEELENEVRLSVIDQGAGIAPDKITHLFDRYWQSGEKSKNSQGLGLGLYISAEIIRRHGGQVGVDSVIGQGTTFWFTLPKP
ncbi:ATP-binding protein [Pedobacter sp. GSP4]|uniref:ATP-binding protein n=1 Tax=Pedobacter sp. GSP4 TaxID=3453716 RepID=UPI003EEEDE07